MLCTYCARRAAHIGRHGSRRPHFNSLPSHAVLSSTEKSADPRVAYNGARTSKSLPLGISNGCVPDEKLTGSSELK